VLIRDFAISTRLICDDIPKIPSPVMANLANPLATVEQLYRYKYNSLPTDLQDTVFFATQCLTQAAGLLLELPQSLTAQANILLARYWLVESPMADEFSVSSPREILDFIF
jgi:cyclin L